MFLPIQSISMDAFSALGTISSLALTGVIKHIEVIGGEPLKIAFSSPVSFCIIQADSPYSNSDGRVYVPLIIAPGSFVWTDTSEAVEFINPGFAKHGTATVPSAISALGITLLP